jgi:hypothetical protein
MAQAQHAPTVREAAQETGLLRELVQLLQKQGGNEALCHALAAGRDHYTALCLPRALDASRAGWLQLQPGPGMPQPGMPAAPDFATYLTDVVTPIVDAYKRQHPQHPYDDRKFRLNRFSFAADHGRLQLELGPTVYQQYRADLGRSRPEALERMLRGVREAGDPHHFFSKMLGITVIILSREGYAFLGERIGQIDHPGLFQFVAGAATFHADLTEVNFWEDVQTEILQETGWEEVVRQPTLQFIGITGQPYTSEVDLVFLMPTGLEAAYFQHPTLCEHERMLCLRTARQARQLLGGRQPDGTGVAANLLYPARFGLTYLLQHHWKKRQTATNNHS